MGVRKYAPRRGEERRDERSKARLAVKWEGRGEGRWEEGGEGRRDREKMERLQEPSDRGNCIKPLEAKPRSRLYAGSAASGSRSEERS